MMTKELILQYAVYLAIIIVGLLVLWLIKQKTKLPTHIELRKRLEILDKNLKDFVRSEKKSGQRPYDFFKRTARCIYTADKLIYIVTLMAEKERDGNLDTIAKMLENVRNSLSPYKFKLKSKEDISGLISACDQMSQALAALDLILQRDKDMRACRSRSR